VWGKSSTLKSTSVLSKVNCYICRPTDCGRNAQIQRTVTVPLTKSRKSASRKVVYSMLNLNVQPIVQQQLGQLAVQLGLIAVIFAIRGNN